MRPAVIIAPDSFKGTASSFEAAQAIAAGWSDVRPGDFIRVMPMADGGEGTLDALEYAVRRTRRIPVAVTGPDNRPVPTYWLLLPDGSGVVELANTSGIGLLNSLRPMDAHSLGFGQAIASALDFGVQRLFLAIGGSSSTDCGSGLLSALGGAFLSEAGGRIPLGNRGLAALARVDMSHVRSLPPNGVTVLTDVNNPLLGPLGAAATYGPQKGAETADLEILEENLTRIARLMPVEATTPGAGAAGGVGFGLLAWGAELTSGAEVIAEAIGLPRVLARASVLVTGEGKFDGQSAAGKVASYLLRMAADTQVQTMLVAGMIESSTEVFYATQSLAELAGSPRNAMSDPLRWLQLAGSLLAEGFVEDGAVTRARQP